MVCWSILWLLCCVNSFTSAETTTIQPFRCQNGQMSQIQCNNGFFGRRGCNNRTLTCEGGKYCCERLKSTITGETLPATSTQPSEISSTEIPRNCEKCDISARHDCFMSLHHFSNSSKTSTTLPQSCIDCKNCCADAFPQTCEMWKSKKFCDLEWYTNDKKQILCGKTCGLCS